MRGLSEATTGAGCVITSSSGCVQQHHGTGDSILQHLLPGPLQQSHDNIGNTPCVCYDDVSKAGIPAWPQRRTYQGQTSSFPKNFVGVGAKRCFDNHGHGCTLDYKMIGDS